MFNEKRRTKKTNRKESIMMKKTLLVAGLATVMTVSTGLAVASAQEVIDDTPITVPERDRDQLRDCDPNGGGAIADQVRDQIRDREHDQDCDLCDGDAVKVQEQKRARLGADGEAGFSADRVGGTTGAGHGQGVLDGTGPQYDGPEDGTGNKFGPAGR